MNRIPADWFRLLRDEFEMQYFKDLMSFLQEEYRYHTIYPDEYDIFNAFRFTSYDRTRVVILGQDPYINPNEAHGLAFSVYPSKSIPPSLRNIFQELERDVGCYIPDNGCLASWAMQGVFLLNTILTVRQGESNSHANRGWEIFTGRVLEIISQKEGPVVYMLWGRKAQNLFQKVENPSHLILRAPHPSPLAGGGFSGCSHFSLANTFLEYQHDIDRDTYKSDFYPIDWQIKNITK